MILTKRSTHSSSNLNVTLLSIEKHTSDTHFELDSSRFAIIFEIILDNKGFICMVCKILMLSELFFKTAVKIPTIFALVTILITTSLVKVDIEWSGFSKSANSLTLKGSPKIVLIRTRYKRHFNPCYTKLFDSANTNL